MRPRENREKPPGTREREKDTDMLTNLYAKDAVITWTPKIGILVGPKASMMKVARHKRHTHWIDAGRDYDVDYPDHSPYHNVTLSLFIAFNTLVVRDGIDPLEAHREFIKIRDYTAGISPDQSGATNEDGEIMCAENVVL